MKKSLIALAVLAASGASFAQSTVTIYGLLDAYVGSSKSTVLNDGSTAANVFGRTLGGVSGNTVRNTTIGSGGFDGDRWGLKGSEDLGGGLKANFVLEQGFAIDSGAGTAGQAFARYSYVSFSGGFGEVKLGKTGTAYDDVENSANAVFNSKLSALAQTFRSNNDYTWNPANSILYATPDFGGFSGEVSYALGENKTTTVDAGSIAAFNVKYAQGPVLVTLGYQTEKANGNAVETKFTQLNGAYDFGPAKLQLVYGRVTQDNSPDTNEYQIGVTVPVTTALAVSVDYASSKDDAFGATAELKRSGYGLGLAYTLSKRTFVYGGYTASTAKQDGFNNVDTSLLAVGVHHTF